ncbi:MAG TPA: hypothetical protein V6C81_07855 [Planktothrix sp.]|jgi:hypothetical protein
MKTTLATKLSLVFALVSTCFSSYYALADDVPDDSERSRLNASLKRIATDVSGQSIAVDVLNATAYSYYNGAFLQKQAEQELSAGRKDMAMIEFALAALQPLSDGDSPSAVKLLFRSEVLADQLDDRYKVALFTIMDSASENFAKNSGPDKFISPMLMCIARRQFMRVRKPPTDLQTSHRFVYMCVRLDQWFRTNENMQDVRYLDEVIAHSILQQFETKRGLDLNGLDHAAYESLRAPLAGCSPGFYPFMIGMPQLAESVYSELYSSVKSKITPQSEIGLVPFLAGVFGAQLKQVKNVEAQKTLEEALRVIKKRIAEQSSQKLDDANSVQLNSNTSAGSVEDWAGVSLEFVSDDLPYRPEFQNGFEEAINCSYELTKKRVAFSALAFLCLQSRVNWLVSHAENEKAFHVASEALAADLARGPVDVRDPYRSSLHHSIENLYEYTLKVTGRVGETAH